MISSIRRECLDHVIVLDERSLRRILACYFGYYHRSRTHLSLGKDSSEPRPIQRSEIGAGRGDISGGWLAPSLRTTGRLKQPMSARDSAVLLDPLRSVSDLRACLPSTRPISFVNANSLPNRLRDPNLVARQPIPDPVRNFR